MRAYKNYCFWVGKKAPKQTTKMGCFAYFGSPTKPSYFVGGEKRSKKKYKMKKHFQKNNSILNLFLCFSVIALFISATFKSSVCDSITCDELSSCPDLFFDSSVKTRFYENEKTCTPITHRLESCLPIWKNLHPGFQGLPNHFRVPTNFKVKSPQLLDLSPVIHSPLPQQISDLLIRLQKAFWWLNGWTLWSLLMLLYLCYFEPIGCNTFVSEKVSEQKPKKKKKRF